MLEIGSIETFGRAAWQRFMRYAVRLFAGA